MVELELKELGVTDCYETKTRFSIALCKQYQDYIFVFGDNEQRVGRGGQAIIRDCVNVVGIRTKKSIFEYWTDDTYESNIQCIDEDISSIMSYLYHGYKIIFSSYGYGNGLAELPKRAPRTYEYLKHKLFTTFGLTF